MKRVYFFLFVLCYVATIFYLAATTPLTPHEAKHYYATHDIVSLLMHWGEVMVGAIPSLRILGVRIYFILFGLVSIVLFYHLTRRYFKHPSDATLSTLIFMILPGIVTGMILANVSIIVLVLVLLFVLCHERCHKWQHIVVLALIMLALFFVHRAAVIFFVAVVLYAWIEKEKKLLILSLSFTIVSLYLSKGIEIGGRPSGHFLEIFGLYAAVFSPLLFLYFFYAMYRILLRESKTLLWYISFTALAFSLLLSLRQKVYITDFAPYVMLSVMLMLNIYNHSVRVRLPEFQRRYRIGFWVVMGTLFLSFALTVLHRPLFELLKDPTQHFAYRIYKIQGLAEKLASEGVSCYDSRSKRVGYTLRFYGIPPCNR